MAEKLPWEEYAAVASAPQEPPAAPWEEYAVLAPKAEPSALDNALASPAGRQTMDIAKGLGVGAVKGQASLLGLPGDVGNFLGDATTWLGDQALGYVAPETLARLQAQREEFKRKGGAGSPIAAPTSENVNRAIQGVFDDYYKPETTAGEYAQTIGEFVSPAVTPGLAKKGAQALGSALGRGALGEAQSLWGVTKTGLKYGVAPGVASETAGQATEGTKNEPFARAIAPLLVAGPLAFRDAMKSNRPLQEILQEIPAAEREAALEFMKQAEATGSRILFDEALNQITGNKYPRLADLRQMAEDSRVGGKIIAPIMAERPKAGADLFKRVADEFGQMPETPFEVAPKVKAAAEGELTRARQDINKGVEGLYAGARESQVSAEQLDQLAQSPIFQSYATKINADPVLRESLGNIDPSSIGYLDVVKKAVDADLNTLTSPLTPGRDNARIAALSEFKDRLTGIADEASPAYQEARRIGAEGRQNVLAPLERSPTGQLAATSDIPEAWKQQADILFSADTPGTAKQAGEAMRTVMTADPEAGKQLARLYLQKIFEDATANLMGGENQWGPAKLAKALTGKDRNRESLRSVLTEVNPDAVPALDVALKIFEAQGRRQGRGSATALRQQLKEDLSESAPTMAIGAASKIGRGFSPLKELNEAAKRMTLNYNMESIANALIDPEATRKILKLSRFMPQAEGTALRLTNILNQAGVQASKGQPALPPHSE